MAKSIQLLIEKITDKTKVKGLLSQRDRQGNSMELIMSKGGSKRLTQVLSFKFKGRSLSGWLKGCGLAIGNVSELSPEESEEDTSMEEDSRKCIVQ